MRKLVEARSQARFFFDGGFLGPFPYSSLLWSQQSCHTPGVNEYLRKLVEARSQPRLSTVPPSSQRDLERIWVPVVLGDVEIATTDSAVFLLIVTPKVPAKLPYTRSSTNQDKTRRSPV